jgi:hypothetical protein
VGLRARMTVDGGGAPLALDALLSAGCAPPRARGKQPTACVCVYLYRNTAFGEPFAGATRLLWPVGAIFCPAARPVPATSMQP